ncbi:MAG: sugar phosphate isomerase/epimerase [Anaerolineae bacterium]|nr:sugar phosphate isomerase/epimerase [Anaerolineae bacterium]
MRLGGFFNASLTDELGPLCEKLDCYGLSAIAAPFELVSQGEADLCSEYGEKARSLGLVIGEAGYWENLMTQDEELRSRRIAAVRRMLLNADAMGCRSVVSLVGTRDASDRALAPHPYMFADSCKAEFREVVLRILDGLDLSTTKYIIEPWCNTFFYQPEDIREFIDSVDHPFFGLHLDQMNMIGFRDFYNTTDLINHTFDILAQHVVSVHLKDIRWDYAHMMLKWDEVYIGDGVMDYGTYLTRLAELPEDMPCYCEHMAEERDYAVCFARLHHLARKVGACFERRSGSATS